MDEMMTKPGMLVIGAVPSELRDALAMHYRLVSHVLEGADAQPLNSLPGGFSTVLTRAVCGLPTAVMDASPALKLVLSLGAGLEKIDMSETERRGITVVNTPNEMTEDVADYAIGMLYALERQLPLADAFVRYRKWGTKPFPLSRRVAGRAIGIVGMGRIGQRIAEKAQALDMVVHYHSRRAKPELPHHYHASMMDLAAVAKTLVLACAGTEETRHIINAAVLGALGSHGIIINVARGSVIDEDALIAALEGRTIRGAALDVFAAEPTPDPRLRALDNVILSPHAASLTEEARAAAIARLVDGGRQYLQNLPSSMTEST